MAAEQPIPIEGASLAISPEGVSNMVYVAAMHTLAGRRAIQDAFDIRFTQQETDNPMLPHQLSDHDKARIEERVSTAKNYASTAALIARTLSSAIRPPEGELPDKAPINWHDEIKAAANEIERAEAAQARARQAEEVATPQQLMQAA